MPERRRPLSPKETKPRSRSRALVQVPVKEVEKPPERLSPKEQNEFLWSAFNECSPKQKRDRYEEERARIQFLYNSDQPPYFILQAIIRLFLTEIRDPSFSPPDEQSLSERQEMRLQASREKQEGLKNFLAKIEPLLRQEADLHYRAIWTTFREGGEATVVERFLEKKSVTIQEQEMAMDSFLRQRATLFDRELFLQEVAAVERLASKPIDWQSPILRERVAATYSTLLQCATHQPDAFSHLKFLIAQTGINPAEWKPPFIGLDEPLGTYIGSLVMQGDLKRVREAYAFQGRVLSEDEEDAMLSIVLGSFASLKSLTRRVESFEEGKVLYIKKRKEFFEYGGEKLTPERRRQILLSHLSMLIPYIKAEDEPLLIKRFAFFLDQVIHEFGISVEEWEPGLKTQLLDTLAYQRYSLPLHYAERAPEIEKIEQLTGLFTWRTLPHQYIEGYVLNALEKCSDSHAPSELGPYLKAVRHFINLTPETKSYIHERVRRGVEGLARMEGNRFFPEQMSALTEAGLVGVNIKTPKLEWIRHSVASQGLLFDPYEAAEGLDVQLRAMFRPEFSTYLKKTNSEDPRAENADRILRAYVEGGWPLTVVTVNSLDISVSEKSRFMIALIHGDSSRTFLSNVSSLKNTAARSLFEALDQLDLPVEIKKDLVREVYVTKLMIEETFPDAQEIQVEIPPVDLTHPRIVAARARLTKSLLQDSPILGLGMSPTEFQEFFFNQPSYLPPSEWSEEHFKEFAPLFELKRPLFESLWAARSNPFEGEGELFKRLQNFFKDVVESERAHPEKVYRLLFVYADKVERFCKRDPAFRDLYEEFLAVHVVQGLWPLDHLARQPGQKGKPLSFELTKKMLKKAIELGKWEVLPAVRSSFVGDPRLVEEEIREGIRQRIPFAKNLNGGASAWFVYVIREYPDLITEALASSSLSSEDYHLYLGTIYASRTIPNLLTVAPGVDPNHPFIQAVLARQAVEEVSSGNTLLDEGDLERIHWQNVHKRSGVAEMIWKMIPPLSTDRSSTKYQASIQKLKLVQERSGFRISAPIFWYIPAASAARAVQEILSNRVRIVKETGEHPEDRAEVFAIAQERLDSYCAGCHGSAKEYLQLFREHGLEPSETALHKRILLSLQPEYGPEKGIELLKAFGKTVELSVEQIEGIKPTSPRIEALIYSMLLPKQGLERAAAEEAFKKRSPLAALTPHFLAIQSPAKREEFCAYKQQLEPLLKSMSLSLTQENENKALLLFLKEFGMQNLPKLAWAIIGLYGSFQKPPTALQNFKHELEVLLGAQEVTWTFEEYIIRIHELIDSIRVSILEDTALDPRIEQSGLGMELFNAVVPHTGSYQSVKDRPELLALVRTNREKFEKEPFLVPASKLVMIAEQEHAAVEESGLSRTEQAIAVRKEQIQKKMEDETLQRFVQGFERSARLMELEPTGQSRIYWFSIIRERWQEQVRSLKEKCEKVENQKGREALTRQIERRERSLFQIEGLIQRDQSVDASAPSPADLLEELQSLFVNAAGKVDRVELESEAGDVARAFTLIFMRAHSELHYRGVTEAREKPTKEGLLSPELVNAWETWFREEYMEHFAGLNADVDVQLSTATRLLLQKIWRVDGLATLIEQNKKTPGAERPTNHPFIDSFRVIRKLEQEIARLVRNEGSGNQRPLQFWPVKGIGRVLAGDIANACYNHLRQVLAQGGEKKITALLMTIPGETEIAGSTLLIDTKTVSGKRVLVIRALNPTEAVIRKSLDARAVVEATIEYIVDMARSTSTEEDPVQEVRLCHDRTGGHSTNRQEIYGAEAVLARERSWMNGEALENVTETNFNGYNIHDARQTLVVWSA